MPTKARDKCYIWPTWIAPILAGDKQCEFALWFRANHYYKKRPPENENQLAQWKTVHAAAVRARADLLRADGWNVRVEDQNKFTYRGVVANVGGCPDLVATRDAEARIEDCKTGRERDSDFWQVMIYILLAPLADPDMFAARDVSGAVVYTDRIREVEPISATLRAVIVERVKLTAADTPPPTTPSYGECRYCDIACCADRVLTDPECVPHGALSDGGLF